MNEIIAQARDSYHKTKNTGYKTGNVWDDNGGNRLNLKSIINDINSPEDVYNEVMKHDMYAITIRSPQLFDLMMDWYKERYPHIESETPNFYKMDIYCEEILEAGIEPQRIIELGGGNGQFLKKMKKYFNVKLYVDIDIPESLYMAYVCTRHWFPEARVLWVVDSNFNIEDYDFIFCPVQLADVFIGKKFDIFVNTASMGEMSNQNIRQWMDFVQNKIQVDYFFGFNRFLNTVPENENDNWNRIRQNENECSVIFDTKWEVLKWEVEPLFARCPYEDPRIARYLEIILKRTETSPLTSDYLDRVKMEDWWRYRDVGALATHRDNQLVNDYTEQGTLFKLWNAIRYGLKEAVPMILEYFNHIGRKQVKFEEEYYYKKLI